MKKKSPIVNYYHCRHCLSRGERDQVAVGSTIDGMVVVWCEQCDQEVVRIAPVGEAPGGPCAHCESGS